MHVSFEKKIFFKKTILSVVYFSEGFRSIENKNFPTSTNKNNQDLIYEMQNNERERLDLHTLVDRTAETFR
jgi:hypothetical protein